MNHPTKPKYGATQTEYADWEAYRFGYNPEDVVSFTDRTGNYRATLSLVESECATRSRTDLLTACVGIFWESFHSPQQCNKKVLRNGRRVCACDNSYMRSWPAWKLAICLNQHS
jgi:hypothetical protein